MSFTQMQMVSDQLETLAHEFRHAAEEARELLRYNDETALRKRPSPSSWSALECLVHLNLATQAMLPGMREALEAAPPSTGGTQTFKMDLPGRLLAWSLEPPAFIKLKAPNLAQPLECPGPESVLQQFAQLHNELVQLVQAAAGKQIDRQKMKSPFANMHYNAYSAFRIISAHDRRHLSQAHQALQH
jgi:DinB superfamily